MSRSSYDKYFLYKIKYLNLKNKMTGGNPPNESDNNLLIYEKKISYLPNEYLQNILFIIITNNNLNIKDFYINYIPEPVEQFKSTPKYLTIHIYAINGNISDEQKNKLTNSLNEKLQQHS